MLREFVGGRGGGIGRGFGFGSGVLRAGGFAEQEAIVGKFFNQAASFELGEHLEERVAGGFFDLERAGDVLKGDGTVSKLKKTKDVVGTQVRWASHERPFQGARRNSRFYALFEK